MASGLSLDLVTSAAVSSAASAVTPEPASSAAIPAAEFLFRFGFINRDGFSVEHAAIELLNRRLSAFFCFHFDKTESSGLAGELIPDDRRGYDFSCL
jgi:hypothetical protein